MTFSHLHSLSLSPTTMRLHPLAFFVAASSASSADSPLERTGRVHDARCDVASLDSMNPALLDQLDDIVKLPIFRYHKLDLRRECPYWEDDGMCGNRACAVSELEGEQVPPHFRVEALSALTVASVLDDKDVPISLSDGCVVSASDFCVRDDESLTDTQKSYVDLLANPERFTGYAGTSAARVWTSIYEENCFGLVPPPLPLSSIDQPVVVVEHRLGKSYVDLNQETCLEKRVYYRVLSGLHSSISMHICSEYLHPTLHTWGPSLECFKSRLGTHTDRLEHLYFTYALMLRSLAKVGPTLVETIQLCTGDDVIDAKTKVSLRHLVTAATQRSGTYFDERQLFNGQDALSLKNEFKDKFRNVSQIMNCVGCERCRLWGKIQVSGIGTALKLLFEYEVATEQGEPVPDLTRSELVSFVNTLHQISKSISKINMFQQLWKAEQEESFVDKRKLLHVVTHDQRNIVSQLREEESIWGKISSWWSTLNKPSGEL